MTGARVRSPAAALAALAALAAAPADGWAALSYDFSLGARVMHTDNLYLDPEAPPEGGRGPVEETVYAALPALRLDWREGRDSLLLDLRSEYWVFSGDEERDPLWIPDFSADVGWRRWSPFFLEGAAVRERVPSTQEREGESILEQADRTWVQVRTGLAWERGTDRTVEVAYRGSFEDFATDEAAGVTGQDDRVVSHFGEGRVRHRWSPRWAGEASARYGQVEQELADDYTELGVVAGVDYLLSERLTALARLEWQREEVDVTGAGDGGAGAGDVAETRDYLLGSAEIRRALERGGFWSLRYEDRLEAQPDGDTLEVGRASAAGRLRARLGSEIGGEVWHEKRDFTVSGREETDWGPTLVARWVIAPWVALDVGGGWTDATIREPGEEEIEDRTARLASVLSLLLGRHFVVEAGYSYRNNDSTDEERSYTANLFYAGASYRFGAAPPGVLPPSSIERLISVETGLSAGR